VASPGIITHGLAGVGIDRRDLSIIAVAHAEQHVCVVQKEALVIPRGQQALGLADPQRAEARVRDISREFRARAVAAPIWDVEPVAVLIFQNPLWMCVLHPRSLRDSI